MIVTFISVDLQGYAHLFAVKLCFTDAGKIVTALPPPNTDHRESQASAQPAAAQPQTESDVTGNAELFRKYSGKPREANVPRWCRKTG